MKQYIDLHSHTIYSDGSDTPESLVRAMHMSGVNVMALTDHDTLAGYSRAKAEADLYGFRILPGIEISTTRYHILGLNVNPNHIGLQKLLQRSQEYQIEECHQRIDILAKQGMPLTFEKLIRLYPESRLGKWNVIMAAMADPECREYILEQNGDMMSPRESFEFYLGKKGIAARIEHRETIHSKEAIDAIHEAGGIAIIAHPFKEVKDIEKELRRLREEGIDGLEIQPNYGEQNESFREYSLKHGLMMTYGSDFHGAGYNRALLGKRENGIELEVFESMLNKWRT
ncbi:MAG: PHP domain-containing protein [Nanoarchaeota archaeon]